MKDVANSADQLIEALDSHIFDAIPSETTSSDRESILLLQRCVRSEGEYAYLEIGSYIGGTLQPFYADDRCRLIYSIDKRPDFVPDERGRMFYHYDQVINSTQTMRANLAKAFPQADSKKVRTFDCDASELDRALIEEHPKLCFIDAEHTNEAVFRDFQVCLEVVNRDGIVAFHDAGIIFQGLRRICEHLTRQSIRFRSLKLGGSVYAILLNDAADRYAASLEPHAIDEEVYFVESARELAALREQFGRFGLGTIKRSMTKSPRLFRLLRAVKRTLVRPTRGSI